MPEIKVAIFRLLGVLFAAPAIFFAYYTVRLVYVNLAVQGVAAHRQSGMYIGAVAFPIATLVFAWLSIRCFGKA
jgi:hypothetical protein